MKNAETNINTKLKSMQAEVKKDMSDFADGMRREAGETSRATLDAAKGHSTDVTVARNKAHFEDMDALETRINETLQAHSAAADATQAQWQRDNQEFIKNEISQHVRHYAGHEKRIRALEGRKVKP